MLTVHFLVKSQSVVQMQLCSCLNSHFFVELATSFLFVEHCFFLVKSLWVPLIQTLTPQSGRVSQLRLDACDMRL